MPFNGTGTFARLRSWVADAAAGLSISPSLMDSDTNDITSALNNVITRDGQGGPTADIPWNGHKITGLGTAVNPGDAVNFAALSAGSANGCCRLYVQSGTALVLLPYNGASLLIGGTQQIIPAAGVTVTPTTPATSTLYYVYAYMSTATTPVMMLATSTTGYVIDNLGGANMSGNAAYRLVGMVYTTATGGAPFADNAAFRGCLNWFNRRSIPFQGPSTGGGVISSGTPVNNAGFPAIVLTWSDEAISTDVVGYATTSVANAIINSRVYVDGSGLGMSVAIASAIASGQISTLASYCGSFSDGVHTVTPGVSVNSGSAQIYTAVTGIIRG